MVEISAGINTEAGSTSNHAWVWADFKQEELFGKNYRDYRKVVYRLKADDFAWQKNIVAYL